MYIVTLSSDIGQHDYLVAAVKGQLLSYNSSLNIVDITHYLSQSNFPKAAYICNNAFRRFPEGTCHVVLLSTFESNDNQILVARHNNQFIVCPDNGILTMILKEKPKDVVALRINDEHTLLERTELIAKAVDQLSRNTPIDTVGTVVTTIIEKYPLRPSIGPNWIDGQILFIDNFENVIINITKEEFEEYRKGRNFKIVFKGDEMIDTISNNYSSVNEGEPLAWFNSAGYLEIAINKGNIASLFGLQGFNEKMQQHVASLPSKWFYQSVRIYFQ